MQDHLMRETPWVEAPDFARQLSIRKEAAKHSMAAVEPFLFEAAEFYNQNGYFVFEDDILQNVDVKVLDDYVYQTFTKHAGRVQDAWMGCEEVRKIAIHPLVMKLLKFMYERNPVPFQTLNFINGTEQATHSDSIHFSCLPARYMCGVWVALEDITLKQGPLHYYESSHKLPEYDYQDLKINVPDDGLGWSSPIALNGYGIYEQKIDRIAKEGGFARKDLSIKQGAFLIWSSNLFHGGSLREDMTLSRKSQVTHYYFDGVVPITPMFSNMKTGDYYVRRPMNIVTRTRMEISLNNQPITYVPSGNDLFKIEVKTDANLLNAAEYSEERSLEYLKRYPDIAASTSLGTPAGAFRHYTKFGAREGRIY